MLVYPGFDGFIIIRQECFFFPQEFVRKAKVLVTNPTHFAVALDYEKDRTPLPVILAKGQGVLAQRMIETAREEGIPIMRNVPLARSLYEQGTENAYIPQDLIGPVAEVLRWVQSLRQG